MPSGEQVRKALSNQFGADGFEIRRIESVGPKVGKELAIAEGLGPVIAATVMMGIYIWFRFELGLA